tara:strand:+ start:155 stop:682 length:528 start_codon:yes stop_codon:yes gene_type:complete
MTRKKLLCLGQGRDGKVFIEASLKGEDVEDWRLSLSGIIGPKHNGDAIGGCGQIQDHLLDGDTIEEYFEPWCEERVLILKSVWDEYHLNDMTAGSPTQEAFLKDTPLSYPNNNYETKLAMLERAGLSPDPNFNNPHTNEPYVYGSAWLHTKIPPHIVGWFSDLPETTELLPKAWR